MAYVPPELHLVSYNCGGIRVEMVNHIYKDLQQSPSIFTLILLVEALSSCLWVELRGVPTPRKGLLERLLIHCQGREFQAGITGLMLLYADFFCAVFCGNSDISFSKMSMSPQKVKSHGSGVYIHRLEALEDR